MEENNKIRQTVKIPINIYLYCVATRSDFLCVFEIINSSSSISAKYLNLRFVFYHCQIKIQGKVHLVTKKSNNALHVFDRCCILSRVSEDFS